MESDSLGAGNVLAPHVKYGERPLYYFFAFVGAHEARHACQIHEIVASLGVAREALEEG
jgi:hypothetical protein